MHVLFYYKRESFDQSNGTFNSDSPVYTPPDHTQ